MMTLIEVEQLQDQLLLGYAVWAVTFILFTIYLVKNDVN